MRPPHPTGPGPRCTDPGSSASPGGGAGRTPSVWSSGSHTAPSSTHSPGVAGSGPRVHGAGGRSRRRGVPGGGSARSGHSSVPSGRPSRGSSSQGPRGGRAPSVPTTATTPAVCASRSVDATTPVSTSHDVRLRLYPLVVWTPGNPVCTYRGRGVWLVTQCGPGFRYVPHRVPTSPPSPTRHRGSSIRRQGWGPWRLTLE